MGCALSGIWLFQFFGNATLGYIHTHSLFYWWSYQWVNPESETQHGILILAISAWLLFRNLRREPTEADGQPALGNAAAAMIGGLLIHAMGFVAEQARISIIGLLLFSWGFAAFAGGTRWARSASFPLAFMVFAIPLSALDSVGFWLRMGVVAVGSRLVHLVGIGVLVNGTQLLSPDGLYDYDVAAACSGVRSLVALAALALLVGYLQFRPIWLRAAFLVMSFPLIFAGNVARIVSIVIAAHLGGKVWGDRAHEIMGYGVFAIVLGGVLLAAGLIARFWPGLLVQPEDGADRSPRQGSFSGNRAAPGQTWALAACAVLASMAVAAWLNHVAHLPERGRAGIALTRDGLAPVELPTFVGTEWIGKAAEVTEVERQLLPPDTGFSRKVYVSVADPSNRVFLSIVLSGRDRSSIHRPELCLVGQGWTIRESAEHVFSRAGVGRDFKATLLRVERKASTPKGEVRIPQLVAYYFVGGDTIAATHWERLATDAWNRVFHGRADRWAYVLMQTGDSDGEQAALGRFQEVLDGALPIFQKAN